MEPRREGELTVKSTRLESKADQTTTSARKIIEAERAKRDAKTAQLKAARLAREVADDSDGSPAQGKEGEGSRPWGSAG